MSGTSPEAILYDSNGNLLAVQNATAIPSSTPGLLFMGSDGTNSRYITIDSSGHPVIVGAGIAGTPSGGVVSIQGVSGGTAVTISGTVTSNQGTSPWVNNITQFGGNNIVTGTGASGIGIPRVTVSNDSNILATQSGTWTVQQGTPPWSTNLTQIAGNAVSTAASGVQKIGIVGNAGATMDAAGQNASSPANELLVAAQFNTTPTTVSTGNVSPLQIDSGANLKVNVNVALPTGSNTIGVVNQGTSASLANAWSTNITDTTNGPVAVKAASTTAVAADQALVVTMSPNSAALQITQTASTATTGLAIGKITNGGAVAGTLVAIRDTTYNEQTSNAQRSISSSSANDTNSAGTGARQVKITYYSTTGAGNITGPFTETVNLNGTTAVNTVSATIAFIEKLEVISVGSNNANVGTITLFISTGGAGGTIGTIETAVGRNNRTYWAHHYVPTGKTVSLATLVAGTQGNQNAEIFLKSIDPTTANSVDEQISDSITVGLNSPSSDRVLSLPIKVSGPARITMYEIPAGNNTSFFGSFDFSEQ